MHATVLQHPGFLLNSHLLAWWACFRKVFLMVWLGRNENILKSHFVSLNLTIRLQEQCTPKKWKFPWESPTGRRKRYQQGRAWGCLLRLQTVLTTSQTTLQEQDWSTVSGGGGGGAGAHLYWSCLDVHFIGALFKLWSHFRAQGLSVHWIKSPFSAFHY